MHTHYIKYSIYKHVKLALISGGQKAKQPGKYSCTNTEPVQPQHTEMGTLLWQIIIGIFKQKMAKKNKTPLFL